MRERPLLLLIDDELGLVESLTVLLEDQGFEVVSELTGAGGVAKFKELSPDIVLSDVRMPKMSGIVATMDSEGMSSKLRKMSACRPSASAMRGSIW